MKASWITLILIVGAIAPVALAQADSSRPPAPGGIVIQPDDSDSQPQNELDVYQDQMARITIETYSELSQIAQAAGAGQISSERAAYLTRRSYELGIIRLQFLDSLYQIAEINRAKENTGKPDPQIPALQTSETTLVVTPPTSSPDIPESVAKYLELTAAQMAAIQARITQEQRQVQPLLQQLSKNRKAMTTAAHTRSFSNSHVRKLAVEQSHILQQLILANSRLERDVYQILTVEQRQKLNAVETRASDITQRLSAEQ